MALGGAFTKPALAKEAIEGGKVHYNNQRCKPGRMVETGAKLTLRLGWQEKVIIVDDISDRRRGAPEAQKLYHETDDSIKNGKTSRGSVKPCRPPNYHRRDGRPRKTAAISSVSASRTTSDSFPAQRAERPKPGSALSPTQFFRRYTMASRDQFQRFIFEDSQVRGAWGPTGESFQKSAARPLPRFRSRSAG